MEPAGSSQPNCPSETMSELNDNFFARLAKQIPFFKKQVGGAIQKSKLKRNGLLTDGMPCAACGAKFSIKVKVILKTEKPFQYCDDCQKALDEGQAIFVTVEAKPRFWRGFGPHPHLLGKVTVISKEQMDAIDKFHAEIETMLKKPGPIYEPPADGPLGPCPMCNKPHDQSRPCFLPEPI